MIQTQGRGGLTLSCYVTTGFFACFFRESTEQLASCLPFFMPISSWQHYKLKPISIFKQKMCKNFNIMSIDLFVPCKSLLSLCLEQFFPGHFRYQGVGFVLSWWLPCSAYLCWFDMSLFSLIRFQESEFANKDTGFRLLNLNVMSATWFNTWNHCTVKSKQIILNRSTLYSFKLTSK